MIYFVIAPSAVCLYFIVRGLRSPHDKNNTLVALYFTLLPLLGMMVGDAYIEIKKGPLDWNRLVPGEPDPVPLLLGVLAGFVVAAAAYPMIRRKERIESPNQAL